MTTDRFDPPKDSAAPCANCNDCSFVGATEDEANAHMHETLEAAKAAGKSSGHRMTIATPNRESRISRNISDILYGAVERALDEIQQLVDDDHITENEAAHAIACAGNPSTAWVNRD